MTKMLKRRPVDVTSKECYLYYTPAIVSRAGSKHPLVRLVFHPYNLPLGLPSQTEMT